MKQTLFGLSILSASTFCLSAQTVLFEEQFDGTIGYNPASATAVAGDNDWVDFGNRITDPFGGSPLSEGYATAVGGSETVLTGKPTTGDPQLRSDFNVGINKLLVGQAVMRLRADVNNDGIYDASDTLVAADVLASYTIAPFGSPGATNVATESFGTPTVTTEANGWHVFTWPDLGGITSGTSSTVGGLRIDPLNNKVGITLMSFEIDYFRIHETPNPPPTTALDPAALGAEWSLADEWTWNTDDDLEGWTRRDFNVPVPNNGTLGVLGGKLVGQATTSDPQLTSPTLSITEPTSKRVAVEIDFAANPGTTVGGTLFWRVDGLPQDPANSIPLPLVPSDGSPHTVRITFDDDLGGTLTSLRIDPANQNTVTVGLDAVRIYREAPADDYGVWSAAQSWTPGAPNTGATEDFDGDGITNDAERLFGLVPTSPSSINPITATLATNGKFTYQRRDPALSQGTYRVFTSTNLQVWTEDTGISENITPGEIQSVEVTLSATPVDGRLFVRVAAD